VMSLRPDRFELPTICWNYDAVQKGWYVYGMGTVAKDGKQIERLICIPVLHRC
jgi:hypothetical protein